MKALLKSSALVLTILLGSATTATAGSVTSQDNAGPMSKSIGTMAKNDCIDGRLCLWADAGHNGTLGMYLQYPTGQCYSMGVMNNQTTAVWNRTGATVRLYDNADCTGNLGPGSAMSFNAGNADTNLEWYFMNDKVSSFKWF